MNVTRSQVASLRSLLFWLREKHILQNYKASTEQAEKAITSVLKECDSKDIPFRIQNMVLNADVHSDIFDVLDENKIERVEG